jgi:hypothetical protein
MGKNKQTYGISNQCVSVYFVFTQQIDAEHDNPGAIEGGLPVKSAGKGLLAVWPLMNKTAVDLPS